MADKYDKLDRMRADIQRDRDKVADLLARIKQKEAKLKEAEASQIVADVGALNMTPEQLGEFLALIQSGKLNAMMSGGVPASGTTTSAYTNSSGNNTDSDEDFDDMEDIDDEEN